MKINIKGPEGNAHYIMAIIRNIMRERKCSDIEIKTVMKDMGSGDYSHLLDCAGEWCEVVGRKTTRKLSSAGTDDYCN